MKKEIIVCIIIVIAIIVGNIVTQNYTVKSIGILSEELEELKKDVIEAEENGEEEVNENIKNKKEEIKKEWENRYDKLAYFIEHDELEKVETDLTALNSFIETKEYAEANRSRYSAMFDEIIDAAKDCTNVSVLRSYADRAEALKMRLLNEMTQMEQEIALKKAEEVRKRLEEQAKAVGDVNQAQIEAEVQKKVETVKRIRNISIKSMTGTASWKLENTEDVDRYLNELRLKLVSELDTDTIVNIEF